MDQSPIGFPHLGGDTASDERDWSNASGEANSTDGNDPVVAELAAGRRRQALTLAQVAERSGLPESMLSQWELGGASPPLDALHRWAAGLGMSLELVRSESGTSGGYGIDWDCRRLIVQGRPVRLTRMEWNILERLAWTPGQLVTHRDLFRHLYAEEREDRAQATAIRVRISKLRQKVPFRIEARWGQGYVVDGVEPPHRRLMLQSAEIGDVRPSAQCGVDRPIEMPQRKHIREAGGLRFGAGLAERPRGNTQAAQALRMEEPVKRMAPPPPMPTSSAVRAEELGVIERFLLERGATRCPDPRMLSQSAVPSLVWDKMKRKWVRPAAEDCALSMTN
jgi:transcriptional regulator with XRE-family HTH domain